MRAYAIIAGAWIAVLWFFTFGVARFLFAVFPRERAGEITTALFPGYFLTTIALGTLASILLWLYRRDRLDAAALALQLAAVVACTASRPGSAAFAR